MIEPARYRRKDLALIMERSRALPDAVRGAQPDWFLPLSEAGYHVLLALSGPGLASTGDQLEALETSHPELAEPAHDTLARLVEQGLAEEELAPETMVVREPTYRVSELGYAVLLAESGRRRRGRGAA